MTDVSIKLDGNKFLDSPDDGFRPAVMKTSQLMFSAEHMLEWGQRVGGNESDDKIQINSRLRRPIFRQSTSAVGPSGRPKVIETNWQSASRRPNETRSSSLGSG
jgi:hypothetical protein